MVEQSRDQGRGWTVASPMAPIILWSVICFAVAYLFFVRTGSFSIPSIAAVAIGVVTVAFGGYYRHDHRAAWTVLAVSMFVLAGVWASVS